MSTSSFTLEESETGRRLFSAEWRFLSAAASFESLPAMAGVEIAFAGRSNVGKSSLINSLTGRNALARTSSTPGRTQELIFFDGPAHAGLRLVDMPGYGYASAPKAKVASWTALIHKYLQGRSNLARVYVLIDARHGLKEVDLYQDRDLKATTDLRAALKGVLRDHLRVDERALAATVFPDSANVKPIAGLV